MSQANESKLVTVPGIGWFAPVVAVWAWWVYDLHFQWQALVEYRFGWMVMFMVAFLVWDRWAARPKMDEPKSLARCIGLALGGAVFVLLAELYKSGIANTPSTSFALSIGCTMFIAAMLLHGWGPATLRHLLFPLLFLFVAVPLPSILYQKIVFMLKDFVTYLNVETLKVIGIPAYQTANVIQLPNCQVGVDEACSGVRSLQSSIMAALFIGHMMVKRRSLQAWLVVAGVALAVVGNVFRSLFLSITAYRHGIDSLNQMHDAAGWSVLVMTAAGLIVLCLVAARLESRIDRAAPHPGPLPEG